MAGTTDTSTKQINAIRTVTERIADDLDIDAHVHLWDGTRLPLGREPTSPFEFRIAGPGVIAAILRKPTLDSIIRHYVEGHLDLTGGSLIEFGRILNARGKSRRIRPLEALRLATGLRPFLFEPAHTGRDTDGFDGNISGAGRRKEDNLDFIQFHYDLSNEFYALFLDPEMVYSCAYFTDWEGSLEQAQVDKLDMICRKLRLKSGDRFLDIGCGWGGLICHAVQNYGVTAHGITLSKEQLELARAKANRLGLSDKTTFALQDYTDVTGTFDKIASVGMYEHIGLDSIPAYMRKMRSLLSDDGLFLNHAISRHAKKRSLMPSRMRAEQRALAKYIFPGGALDDIGNTVHAMERAGFEVHDVEGWRMHYARTCALWHDRLVARRQEALALVGEAKYRIYIAYLAGCALSFERGTARLFQTLCSQSAKHRPPLPPTRADLYR